MMKGFQRIGARLRDDVSLLAGRVAERLAAELDVARALTRTELEDHLITYLGDVFLQVMAEGEGDRARRENSRDSAAIQAMIAELHGRQRRRFGWSEEQLAREYAILDEEIRALVKVRADAEPEAREVAAMLSSLVATSLEESRRGYGLAAAEANAALAGSASATALSGDRQEAREFIDAVGTTWTVREIKPGPMPPKLLSMLGGERRRGGWLLFLSSEGEKRRLAPIPANWAGLPRFEIERWCMRAKQVPPAPERRAEDRAP
jgi:hypothetical protein